MRRQTVSGIARLRVTVLKDGSVRFVKILDCSQELFAVAAKDAIRDWRFRPALKDGQPVALEIDYAFEFRISVDDGAERRGRSENIAPQPSKPSQ